MYTTDLKVIQENEGSGEHKPPCMDLCKSHNFTNQSYYDYANCS